MVKLDSNGYTEANHAHFTELLREREGIDLSRPTVRRTLIRVGFGSASEDPRASYRSAWKTSRNGQRLTRR